MRLRFGVCVLAAACGSSPSVGQDASMCAARAARPQARTRVDAITAGGTIYVYGGDEAPGTTMVPAPRQLVDELWTYDAACDTWKLAGAQQPPGPIGDYAAAYDSQRNRMILVGGQKGTVAQPPVTGEIWAYDLAAATWAQLAPTGTGPGARVGHALVYDAARDRLVLFGGDRGTAFSQIRGDTFELAFAAGADGAWTQLVASGAVGAPQTLRDAAFAVDASGARALLFGGAHDFTTYANDVWAFDLAANTWSMVATGGDIPSARFGTKMRVDASGRFWLFGGHDPFSLGVLNDTYSLDGATGRFAQVLGGDSSVDVGGVDHASPERRERQAMVALPSALWIFGGSSDCGPMDDVWHLDFAAPSAWTPIYAALIDETCPRRAMPGQQCQPPPNDCTNPF
jgi:Galactose oxidase, central domain